jgi:hypothetical protein
MGRVEEYNTHTNIVDGYKILPVLMVIKLYPYSYPLGTQRIDQIVYTLLTFLLSLIVYRELEHEISVSLRPVDYGQCLITRVIKVWNVELL